MRELLRDEAGLTELVPGITVHGMDVGRWLQTQRQHVVWQGLMGTCSASSWSSSVSSRTPRRKRLRRRPARAILEPSNGALKPCRQYKARTGSVTVSRAHVETLEDGTEVKLGVFLSNTKSSRAKLTADKRQQLAELGLDWQRRRVAPMAWCRLTGEYRYFSPGGRR